jgi:hypothetical protein
MKMLAALLASLAAVTPAMAVSQYDLPPSDEQVRLALSAAPPHLREAAGVLVLEAVGYEVERPSSNGFWCLLERWERAVAAPICYDRVGSASTLQAVRYLETRRFEGAADSTIHAEIDAGYEDGSFAAPNEWGVAYMLSPFGPAPPHVMYYAPYARNAEFGGALGPSRGVLPFIYDEGSPRAYLVQLVDPAAWARLDGRPGNGSDTDR